MFFIIYLIVLIVIACFILIIARYNLKYGVRDYVKEQIEIGQKRQIADNYLCDNITELVPDISSLIKPLINEWGIGNDAGTLTIVTSIITYMRNLGVSKIINDYYSRQLSDFQMYKINYVRDAAIVQFYKLAKEKGWNSNISIEVDQYNQLALEYVEDLLNKAINESNKIKQKTFGAYLGHALYYYDTKKIEWNNLIYISFLIQRLTIRQKILTHLICDNFKSLKIENVCDMCVTNPLVISELKDMQGLNLWRPVIGISPDPTYIAIPLSYIMPTDLTRLFCEDVPVDESMNEKYNNIISSFDLKMFDQTNLPQGFIQLCKENGLNEI